MKHFYQLCVLMAIFLASPNIQAAEWSFEWPVSASSDKESDYANGFYNFSSGLVPDRTTLTRNLNGKNWTAHFQAGTKLTYLSGSGQAVGSTGGFTDAFELTSDAFDGRIRKITIKTRTKLSDATVSASVAGTSYLSDGNLNAGITTSGTEPLEISFIPQDDSAAAEGKISIKLTLPDASTVTYIRSIAVEWEEPVSSVAAPAFNPAGGTFDEPVQVEITAREGATIVYTLDGSNPRAEGNANTHTYTGAVTIAETATLKAVAQMSGEFSSVTEDTYVIRRSPELAFDKEALTIELLEEDLALYSNPYKVSPVKFSSSNPSVAWADSYGHIYTYSVGETVISASFGGDATYLPQTITIPVTVIAKEPLTGLTITPAGGTFTDMTEVKVECTDPRAATLWYHIGDSEASLDDLGLLDEYTINPSTSMTLKLSQSCVLTVQAVGTNVWSEPVSATYNINMPLKAAFAGGDPHTVIYRNGFDSEDEANEWNHSSGSNWQLTPGAGGFRDVPAFSSVNPESKYSLFHAYENTGDVAVVTSPDITLPEDATVRFYALFNPIWIYDGNLQLYVCENVQGAQPEKVWDAFLASQAAATDDIKWTQYSATLDKYAGKEVYFAFTYALTNGDNVLIDDFEVTVPAADSETVSATPGTGITFRDHSTGHPEAWAWEFPGADTETSTEQNPVVVYNRPGTYNVTLTVTKGDETSTVTRNGYVVVRPTAPTAHIGIPEGVYYSPEAGLAVPLNTELTFTDESEGAPESFAWTLPGTDLKSSDKRNVTVKYTEEGTFDIDLAVANEAGTSATYLHGVKAGGTTPVWNISALENGDLGIITLGWYGNYGGTNWLDMDAFAEKFAKPATKADISGVNIYFASVTTVSPNAEITVSVATPDENGLPGQTVATASMPVSSLVDASETYNDPTEFIFDTPVRIESEFFITVSGFPNESNSQGEDNIAMYALRRQPGQPNTAYHLLKEIDDYYQPTGESNWYAQTEDPTSFAIAPVIEFHNPLSGVSVTDAETGITEGPVTYYNLQGMPVNADNLKPGIYIRRQGNRSEKVRF